MGALYILNAGRADCSIIITSGENKRHVAVIDGGMKSFGGRAVLADFLRGHKIDTVDLLILSHVHQDHFGGFWNLIDKVKIKQALMPFGDIDFPKSAGSFFGPQECFAEYHEFYSYLIRTGAKIMFDYQYGMKSFALYEGAELCCRYPNDFRRSENSFYLEQLCDAAALEPEKIREIAGKYQDTCNASSSIWTLENSTRTIALFAGDSTVQTMRTIFPLPKGGPEVFKLSHHGINKNYFSVEQIKAVQPQKSVVVCVSADFYESIQNECDELCAVIGLKPYYTFRGDYTRVF
jgi:beta-lactamase superfamily II metal-dependent hydrolase